MAGALVPGADPGRADARRRRRRQGRDPPSDRRPCGRRVRRADDLIGIARSLEPQHARPGHARRQDCRRVAPRGGDAGARHAPHGGAAHDTSGGGRVTETPVSIESVTAAAPAPTSPRNRRRATALFTEAGLLAVVLLIGILLTTLSGSLRVRDRSTGEFRTVNKFLRAENLDLVAKNTSFFAIMAVGVTFVILTGGIDLSVGATYCLAAVAGAMFFNYFGPAGPRADTSPWVSVPLGIALCLVVGAVC